MIVHSMESCGYGVSDVTIEQIQAMVRDVETALKAAPQVELPLEHQFAYGIYLRKILIPKGVMLTGRVHKQADLQIIFYGDISVLCGDGIVRRYTGHNIFTGAPGVKPLGFAHEDTLWATVHHTHSTDLKEIEKELFEDEIGCFDFETGKIRQEVLT